MVGKVVTVELKNDLQIKGTLHSVDQYLNVKLTDISVPEEERFPHMVRPSGTTVCMDQRTLRQRAPSQLAVKNCFVRGSVLRYIQLPPEQVDTELLQVRHELLSPSCAASRYVGVDDQDATRREADKDQDKE